MTNKYKKKIRKKYVSFHFFLYKSIMTITHKFNWHYAPALRIEDELHLWCKWCGLRQVRKAKDQSQGKRMTCP